MMRCSCFVLSLSFVFFFGKIKYAMCSGSFCVIVVVVYVFI